MSYLVKRILLLIPLVWAISTAVFFLVHLIPGDPIDFILGESTLAADRAGFAASHGFDKPLFEQYTVFLDQLVRGDLGASYFSARPVTALIMERYPATLKLACGAMLLATLIALPLGILAAAFKDRWPDEVAMVAALAGISLPNFYLGPMLVLLFSIVLGWFPVAGAGQPGAMVLPTLTLGMAMAAILARMSRTSLIETIVEDYIRTARAKGVSRFSLWFKHALRPALTPVVTIMGLQFGALLTGAVVTEKVFAWPGLGSLMLEAIQTRDYSVVQGCVLVMAVSYLIVNLVTDLMYRFVDPRVRLE